MAATAPLDPIANRYQGIELPAMPALANRINILCADRRTTTQQLAALILADQGVAVHLLRTVNCALYGMSGRVATIPHAIAVLGFSNVRDLVVAFSMRYLFKKFGPRQKAICNHAQAVALVSRHLALRFAPATADLAYLAGQLHDVGEVILIQLDEEFVNRTAQLAPGQRADAEEEHFGFHHAQIGADLISYWNLPRDLALVAKHHIRPVLAELDHPTSMQLIACVALADQICESRHGIEGLGAGRPDPEEALAILEVARSDFDLVAQTAFAQLSAEAPQLLPSP